MSLYSTLRRTENPEGLCFSIIIRPFRISNLNIIYPSRSQRLTSYLMYPPSKKQLPTILLTRASTTPEPLPKTIPPKPSPELTVTTSRPRTRCRVSTRDTRTDQSTLAIGGIIGLKQGVRKRNRCFSFVERMKTDIRDMYLRTHPSGGSSSHTPAAGTEQASALGIPSATAQR
ncbi:uncharacterized protein BDZ99DRAFT_467370 [Mytilinidion resinicola]|uniref:Uncharacterized protein n=1 Tax=Mytilinidion resinicola TaxID=574789 RepID=A0A6A6Y9M3_9PEZI|nr:uncharacterized protein BDZ99DRAFT_467370 [Mytilinidion resinicola]KAF2804684.1 hypothetical protein BDZ99DRAFT_467370 [Mytilinidion resinicola]